MWKQTVAGLILTLCAVPVFAGSCPLLMNDVDKALMDDAVVSELSASELRQVRDLRAKGEELHQAGRHGESVATLEEALSILGEAGGSGY